MKIIKINLKGDFSKAVDAAIGILQKGGVIVYPTDTIYGLGANACDFRASEQVFKIKQRPLEKPLPVIARNLKWVKEMAYVPQKLEKVLMEIWPGTVTVILDKKDIIPYVVTANQKTVGLRIPDFALTDKIMARFGYPLTATSANISGEEGTGNIHQIINSFQNQLWKPDLIIDAGDLPASQPSTILDLSKIKPRILRVGPSKPEVLIKLLGADYDK